MARLRFRNSSLEEIRLDDSNPNTHTTYHRTLSKSLRLEAHLSGYCGTRRFPSLSLPSQDPVFVQYMVFSALDFADVGLPEMIQVFYFFRACGTRDDLLALDEVNHTL